MYLSKQQITKKLIRLRGCTGWSAFLLFAYGISMFFHDVAQKKSFEPPGWLGWAMVLGSFQCRGILLLLHIVGQGSAVLAPGAGRVGYILYIFHLSSLSNGLSFGRRLNMTEILWTPTVVVSYCRGRHRLVLVNRLDKPVQEQCH